MKKLFGVTPSKSTPQADIVPQATTKIINHRSASSSGLKSDGFTKQLKVRRSHSGSKKRAELPGVWTHSRNPSQSRTESSTSNASGSSERTYGMLGPKDKDINSINYSANSHQQSFGQRWDEKAYVYGDTHSVSQQAVHRSKERESLDSTSFSSRTIRTGHDTYDTLASSTSQSGTSKTSTRSKGKRPSTAPSNDAFGLPLKATISQPYVSIHHVMDKRFWNADGRQRSSSDSRTLVHSSSLHPQVDLTLPSPGLGQLSTALPSYDVSKASSSKLVNAGYFTPGEDYSEPAKVLPGGDMPTNTPRDIDSPPLSWSSNGSTRGQDPWSRGTDSDDDYGVVINTSPGSYPDNYPDIGPIYGQAYIPIPIPGESPGRHPNLKPKTSHSSFASSFAASELSSEPSPSESPKPPSPSTKTRGVFSKFSSPFSRSSQSLLPLSPGGSYGEMSPRSTRTARRRRSRSDGGPSSSALPSPRGSMVDDADVQEESFLPPEYSVYTDPKLFPFPGLSRRLSTIPQEIPNSVIVTPRFLDAVSFDIELRKVISKLKSTDGSRIRRFLSSSDHTSGYQDFVQLLAHAVSDPSSKKKVINLPDKDAQKFVDLIQYLLVKNPKGILNKHNDELHLKILRLQVKVADTRNIFPSALCIKGVKLASRDPVSGGGFADVFTGTWKGRQVALKRIRVFKSNVGFKAISSHIHRECLIWQRLTHEYVLPFLGIDKESFSSLFCLVSPWMRHGTILHYLNKYNITDCASLNRMLFCISDGLAYLHSQNVVHADLRGANILISDEGNPCLSDFGLTVIADTSHGQSTTSTAIAGALRWMAPEVLSPSSFGLEHSQKTFASDVYALSCVAIELFTRKPPFAELLEAAVMLPIIEGKRPSRPSDMEDDVWQLVEMCWCHDHYARPSMFEVLQQAGRWNMP